ncbi:hypothetical protein AX16_000678 [Volvariella volvacea WC 439]|nr:hypothetical protein AX16_000678 [Volvariella volvacea WC 439]
MVRKAPYGTWESPITASLITASSIKLTDVLVDSVTSKVYHIENRPSERGRAVLVETESGRDVVGKEANVRTGVQEYGGAAAIVYDGRAYYSNYTDGRVYQIHLSGNLTGEAEPVTPDNPAYRYANFDVHPIYPHLLIAVLEDHTNDTPATIVTTLHIINTKTKTISLFVSGADFYAQPKFSPDGNHVAWLEWNHPDMPWDGARLFIADVKATRPDTSNTGADILDIQLKPTNLIHVAGERGKISAGYPSWLPGPPRLIFTSDSASGYQTPYVYYLDNSTTFCPFDSTVNRDFAPPAWSLSTFPYTPILGGTAAIWAGISSDGGREQLYLVSTSHNGPWTPQTIQEAESYVSIDCLKGLPGGLEFVFVGGKVDGDKELVKGRWALPAGAAKEQSQNEGKLHNHVELTVLRSTTTEEAIRLRAYISHPRPITVPSASVDNSQSGANQGELYINYYPPFNPEYAGSDIADERPPCVVNVHGGPTGMLGHGLHWEKQYYTSRGWAWLDVNYGGSSGYGRAYRDRLKGNWGIVDVGDCIRAAKYISASGASIASLDSSVVAADPKRLVIRGGSAGGFTVLSTLSSPLDHDGTQHAGFFAAGTSSYGVSDLKLLSEDTHKFESHYLEGLLGGAIEDIPEVYAERSPINHAEKIVAPLLVLQGEVDRVVPIEQAKTIVEKIKSKGGKVEYHVYEGEGHGWRRAENIKDALERELHFYEKTLMIGVRSTTVNV